MTGQYIQIDSIILEAFDPNDTDAPSVYLPKGAIFKIEKQVTAPLPDPPLPGQTGQPQSMYWIKFTGSDRLWVIAPAWWHVHILDALPQGIDNHAAPFQPLHSRYKLVEVIE